MVKQLRNDKTAMHFVDEPWSSYLKKMDLLGTYGDHITLVTVAVLYEVQIIILSSTETATLVSCKGDADFDPTIRCLFIGHFPEGQGEHYVSLEHQTDLLNFCMSKLASTHIPTSCSTDNAAGMPVNTTRHSPRETGTQMPGDIHDIRNIAEELTQGNSKWPSVWSLEQWQEKKLVYPWLFCKRWSDRL